MTLELHIWGPAFGLPSIDPECIAALSYVDYAVPKADWKLVASNDASISPDHILPALRQNETWVSGYRNIVSHIARCQENGIDGDFNAAQQADIMAYASYIASRGAALVAFSLYVSPSAWAELTRPAYSSLLPFPLTWTLPLKLRADAITRTEHLGLDHLAADVDPEGGSSESKTTASTTSTGFLRLPIQSTVSGTMAPEQAAAIRLQSVTEDFLSVLDDLRGTKPYFFGETPSSLDFLSFGYIQLLHVRTPHPFMARCLERSPAGKRLLQLVDGMREAGIVKWQEGKLEESLPWAEATPRGLLGTIDHFTNGTMVHVPGIANLWKSYRGEGVKSESLERDPAQVLLAVGGAVAALAAVGGAMLFRSLPAFGSPVQSFEARKEKHGLHQFGDIGAMFDGLPDFEAKPRPSQAQKDTVYQGDNVEVAIDVKAEGSTVQASS